MSQVLQPLFDEAATPDESQLRNKRYRGQPEEPPKLEVELACASTIGKDDTFNVEVKITYHADATKEPITFHSFIFDDASNFQLYRLQGENWEACEDKSSGCCGFQIYDEDDVPVQVGIHDAFTSLAPEDSWVTSAIMQSEWGSVLPDDTNHGERFRFLFKGATLDWWDWGTKLGHEQTVVELPCWIAGDVVTPRDNQSRPRVVVPPSNVVEFSMKKN